MASIPNSVGTMLERMRTICWPPVACSNRSRPAMNCCGACVGTMRSSANNLLAIRRRTPRVSPGAMGGFGANHHLRQSLVFLNVPTMPQPEAYIGHAPDLFNAEGVMTKEATRTFLKTFMEAFASWVAANVSRARRVS